MPHEFSDHELETGRVGETPTSRAETTVPPPPVTTTAGTSTAPTPPPTDPAILARLDDIQRQLTEQRERVERDRLLTESLVHTQSQLVQGLSILIQGYNAYGATLQHLGQFVPGLPQFSAMTFPGALPPQVAQAQQIPQQPQLAPQQQQQTPVRPGFFSTMLSAPMTPSGLLTQGPMTSTFAGLSGEAGPSSQPSLGFSMTPSALLASTVPALHQTVSLHSTTAAAQTSSLSARTLCFEETVPESAEQTVTVAMTGPLTQEQHALLREFDYTAEELLTGGQSSHTAEPEEVVTVESASDDEPAPAQSTP